MRVKSFLKFGKRRTCISHSTTIKIISNEIFIFFQCAIEDVVCNIVYHTSLFYLLLLFIPL